MGKTKDEILGTLTDAGMMAGSAFAGGLVGHATGRPALGIGIVTTLGGAYLMQKYKDKPYGKLIAFAGMGMLATHYSAEQSTPVSGIDGFLEDAKQRAIAYLKGKGSQTYIDKVSPALAQKMGIMGLGNISYYTTSSLDTSEVDRIISEIAAKSRQTLPVGSLADANELMGADSRDLLGGLDAIETDPITAAYNYSR